MSRLLVTGAGGFVGARVVRQALAVGHDVAALIRPGSAAPRLQGVGGGTTATLHRWRHDLGDAASMDALRVALGGWAPDACIHLAWYVEPGSYLHGRENLECIAQSLALQELLIDAGCGAIVMAGTCAEYDLERPASGCLREDAPTRPATLYAAAKLALATVALQLAAERGTPLAWARLFSLYGPGEQPTRLVPAAIRALLRDERFPATAGEQVRDYLHVDDAAAALVRLAAARASGIFNVASATGVPVRELLALTGELAGRPELIQLGAIPYRGWEPPCICGDAGRLRALGWTPRHTLRSGLADTIDWWRAGEPTAHPTR